MVEPCDEPVAIESTTPEPSPLGSYQWKKGQKRSVWDRLQGWKSSRGSQNKESQKRQMPLFKKSKSTKEPNTGSFVHYLRSVHQKGRKKEVVEPIEVIEEPPHIPPQTNQAPEVPVWDVSNLALVEGRILLSKGEEQDAFRTRSRAGSCVSSNEVVQTDKLDTATDTASDGNIEADTKNQHNNVKGLILKRKKKKTRKKTGTVSQQLDERSLHGSHESLGCGDILDLNNEKDIIIRALHSSILQEQFCFEVITASGSHCFGCSSVQERDRWIDNLRRIVQPDKDNCQREESSLNLWIHEAKGLPHSGPGSRALYFCEVHLDGCLYGRTSSKTAEAGMVFWGESFNLMDLPFSSGHVALHFLREGKEATGVGTVTLALEGMKEEVERWVPLGGDLTLRVRGRYRKLCVRPLEKYKEFAEYLSWKYLKLSRAMEPILSAREKEELGRSMVYVLQSTGQAKEFLVDLGVAEISRYDVQDSLLFRENTILTKAIEEYMKMVGQTYLQETLGPFITRIYASMESHEVDPQRCSPEELRENREHLWRSCEEAIECIVQSQKHFPSELLVVFSSWQEKVVMRGRPELGSRLVSACLFLRFLCPAILSPGLFHLSPEHPHPVAARALTLVAKVLQNLANFTRFGEKEDYMAFMNGFLEQHWDEMSVFLQTVTDPDSEVAVTGYEGSVDLAYELSILHYMLCGIFTGIHQQTKDHLEPLPTILKALAEGLPVPECITQDQSQDNSEDPEIIFPRDMCNLRPLVKKSQSLSSLIKERLFPLPKIEERERKSRRHVTRTQSVPAQTRPGRERRTRQDTSSVAEKDEDETKGAGITKPIRPRQSSTLPRRKSTVPWCRDEDIHFVKQAREVEEDQELDLQEMKGQIAENQNKQKDLAGQMCNMEEKMQKALDQLSKVEEMHKVLQAEMTNQMTQMQSRIDALEKEHGEEKTQREKNEEKIAAMERRLSVLENTSRNSKKGHNGNRQNIDDALEDAPITYDMDGTESSDTD
ncbi:RAS protein activator like-3 isoform X2 [Hyla sarda]|uniref:RAS protein activator like-3 isoform X2 n=1 Tax=Hyla sarda TaxID=327740 RepID=UPI0024C433F8|nr:RAS protein activator like-3 isoform X2 [Hyla sarda]